MVRIVYFFSFPDSTVSYMLSPPLNFAPYSEKQYRNAIMRESCRRIRAARPHCYFAVRAAANLSLDVFRQFVQSDASSGSSILRNFRESYIALARSPRFLRGARRAESLRCEQRNHFLFLLLHAQFRN